MAASVVFEEHGFPVELHSEREIERAVSSGRLRASTIVRTGIDEGVPHTSRASEVAFLRPFLGLREPDADAAARSAPPPVPPPALPSSAPSPATAPPPASAAQPAGTGGRVTSRLGSALWSGSPPPPAAPVAIGKPATPQTGGSRGGQDAGQAGGPRRASGIRPAAYREPASVLGCALMPLQRYAVFAGRSSRREFWGFQVVQLAALMMLFGTKNHTSSFMIVLIGLALPNLAVSVRRLHDHNRSGWFVLVSLIPYVGWLVLVVLLLVEGSRGDNRFGPDPKRPG